VKVAKDHIITIHYTIKDDIGEIVDSSEDEEPLEYLHGHNFMLPGLERALDGLAEGEKVSVWLDPEEGFGNRDEDLVFMLSRSDFGEGAEIEEGMEFDVEDEEGEGIITVLKVEDDNVLVDRNHPLAGKRLHVDAEVIEIKKAETWEIEGWKHHSHK